MGEAGHPIQSQILTRGRYPCLKTVKGTTLKPPIGSVPES